jgi:hypothetical protein
MSSLKLRIILILIGASWPVISQSPGLIKRKKEDDEKKELPLEVPFY